MAEKERGIIGILVAVIVFHAMHIIEELWGNAWFITSLYRNAQNFLIINTALWLIPLLLLYFIWRKKQWAYRLVAPMAWSTGQAGGCAGSISTELLEHSRVSA